MSKKRKCPRSQKVSKEVKVLMDLAERTVNEYVWMNVSIRSVRRGMILL